MNKVTIVVLNYKSWPKTIECLQSLQGLTYPNSEIVVVDNNSQNDSLAHVHEWLKAQGVAHVQMSEKEIETCACLQTRTILLQSANNGGYAAGNNLGIRVGLVRSTDYVLILNNDTVVRPSFLEPLVEYAESHEKVAMVGPKIVQEDGMPFRACARRRPSPGDYLFRLGIGKYLFPNNRWIRRHYYLDEYSFEQPQEVDILCGACILIKSGVFAEIGLLDESTFLFLEEFILHEKLRSVGLASAIVPASSIFHEGGASTSKSSLSLMRHVERKSQEYYLSKYRHFGWLSVRMLMLASVRPRDLSRLLSLRRGHGN